MTRVRNGDGTPFIRDGPGGALGWLVESPFDCRADLCNLAAANADEGATVHVCNAGMERKGKKAQTGRGRFSCQGSGS
jgi:hypothetical protein